MAKEDELLRQLPLLPDLQCAWLLLAYCASPRANHALRTVPPESIKPYAAARDAAVWGTLQACVGEPAEDVECPARAITLLPASLGGLGLTQATRAAHAAYWAAWADSLAVSEARCPRFAAWAVGLSKMALAQHACEPPRLVGSYSSTKAGSMCRPGRGLLGGRDRRDPSPTPLSLAGGCMDGSFTRRVLGTVSSATACCCLPCRPLIALLCVHRLGPTPAHGLRPSQVTPTRRSPRR